MNREDIIRMAREAGIDDWWDSGSEWRETFNAHIERFAALVAAAEREACAKVRESTPWTTDIEWWKQATKKEVGEKSAYECAAAIRARGETK